MDVGKRWIAATVGEEGADELSFPERCWCAFFRMRGIVKQLEWVSVQVRKDGKGHASVDEAEREEGANGVAFMLVVEVVGGKNKVEDKQETFYW